MNSLRHDRGMILDLNAEVSEGSRIDRDSIVDSGEIWESVISRSRIDGKVIGSRVLQSVVLRSELIGTTARWCRIEDSTVYGAQVEGSVLAGAKVRGGVVVDSFLHEAIVTGGTVVRVELEGPVRIGEGTWTRAPRFKEIEGVVITESTDGHAYIQCQRKPMEIWIKGKRRFGRVVGWSAEMLDETEELFRDWLANPIPTVI